MWILGLKGLSRAVTKSSGGQVNTKSWLLGISFGSIFAIEVAGVFIQRSSRKSLPTLPPTFDDSPV